MIDKLAAGSLMRAVERELDIMELVGLASRLEREGEIPFVAELYRVWIRANPDHPLLYAVHYNHAAILVNAVELEAALDALERALAANAHFFQACFLLADVLDRLGRRADAIARCQGALAVLDELTTGAEEARGDLEELKHNLRAKIAQFHERSAAHLAQGLEGMRPILDVLRATAASPPDDRPWSVDALRTTLELARELARGPVFFTTAAP